jgi:predicted small lipoprotein YifL
MIKRILAILTFYCIVSGIMGCGQTGALYLPPPEKNKTG